MTASIKWLAALLVLSGAAMTSACNTVEGAGKDIQRGGEVIENCADRSDPSCQR